MKTGRKVNCDLIPCSWVLAVDQPQLLLPLFTNSREAQLRLLSSTNCKILIASKELMPHWETLRPEVDNFRMLTMPPLEDFLDDHEITR